MKIGQILKHIGINNKNVVTIEKGHKSETYDYQNNKTTFGKPHDIKHIEHSLSFNYGGNRTILNHYETEPAMCYVGVDNAYIILQTKKGTAQAYEIWKYNSGWARTGKCKNIPIKTAIMRIETLKNYKPIIQENKEQMQDIKAKLVLEAL